MSDVVDNHEEDEDENKPHFYKLGKAASLFYDSDKGQLNSGKVLPNQAVELIATERVLAAVRSGHLEIATAKDRRDFAKKAKDAQAKIAAQAPAAATPITKTAGDAVKEEGVTADAHAEAKTIKETAEKEANEIREKAQKDAERIVAEATAKAKKPGN